VYAAIEVHARSLSTGRYAHDLDTLSSLYNELAISWCIRGDVRRALHYHMLDHSLAM
jgi:hypothetical protein